MSSGYKQGTTKAIVIEAQRLGLTREQVMKNTGLTRYAIYSCEWRNGIFLVGESGKVKQGAIKDIAIKSIDAGLTVREAIKKYGVNPASMRSAYRYLGACK